MRRLLVAFAVALLCVPPRSWAAGSSSGPCERSRTVCGTGGGDGFDVGATTVSPGGPASTTGGSGGQAVALPDTYQVVQYAPTCSGNTRTSGDALCGAAAFSCQPQHQGLIRYWEWVVTIDRATGGELGVVQRPGTYCIGPDQAGLPPMAAIAGLVSAEFQRLKVDVGTVRSEPGPRTLVNLETGFSTNASAPYALPVATILGHRVVVTATPESYEWFFGDGSSLRTDSPGAPGTLDVSHTYHATGELAPYVVVTWSGTYTVDGGAPQAVLGTAGTIGPTTRLQVAQARAELVSQ